MCKTQDAALQQLLSYNLPINEDARALVRLLAYAAQEAEHLQAGLAALLIRASIQSLSFEIERPEAGARLS